MNKNKYNKFIFSYRKILVLTFSLFFVLSNISPSILFLFFREENKVNSQTTPGLLVHWKFDEVSGSTALDSSGNNNNGTLVNSPTRISNGKIGGALSFDGVDDYVNGLDIDFPSAPFTISVWFKTNYNGSAVPRIADKAGGWTSINWEIYMEGGYIWGGVYDGNYTGVQDNRRTYNDNQWHLATLVVDSSKIELFVDGTSAGTTTHNNNFPTNNTPFSVGRSSFFGAYLPGQIDDFRIYNRALSAEEILSIYNTSK